MSIKKGKEVEKKEKEGIKHGFHWPPLNIINVDPRISPISLENPRVRHDPRTPKL